MKPRKETSVLALIGAIIGLALIIVGTVVATPLLALLVGMIVGQVLEFFTGDYVVAAFHAIGFTGVNDGDLPKVFGLLAIVALFIKVGASGGTNRRKGDD